MRGVTPIPFVEFGGSFTYLTSHVERFDSGSEKRSYKSMRAICFCTTRKFDHIHYSFIFRKPYTLGTELENVACSMLGTMFYLEIKW